MFRTHMGKDYELTIDTKKAIRVLFGLLKFDKLGKPTTFCVNGCWLSADRRDPGCAHTVCDILCGYSLLFIIRVHS